jgi:hypothetical protein
MFPFITDKNVNKMREDVKKLDKKKLKELFIKALEIIHAH